MTPAVLQLCFSPGLFNSPVCRENKAVFLPVEEDCSPGSCACFLVSAESRKNGMSVLSLEQKGEKATWNVLWVLFTKISAPFQFSVSQTESLLIMA